MICENSGRCEFWLFRTTSYIRFLDIIEFDNYYSWFAAKQLRYNIEIEEPAHCSSSKLADSAAPIAVEWAESTNNECTKRFRPLALARELILELLLN